MLRNPLQYVNRLPPPDRHNPTLIIHILRQSYRPGSFPKTILKPRRRPTVLCDDDVADCEALLESIPDIGSQFDRKTTADVQAILNEALSADGSEGSSSETHKYGGEKDAVDAAFAKLA